LSKIALKTKPASFKIRVNPHLTNPVILSKKISTMFPLRSCSPNFTPFSTFTQPFFTSRSFLVRRLACPRKSQAGVRRPVLHSDSEGGSTSEDGSEGGSFSEGNTPKPNNLSPYLIKMLVVLLISQKDYGTACRANQGRVILRVGHILKAPNGITIVEKNNIKF
jgi:hypothetical protein